MRLRPLLALGLLLLAGAPALAAPLEAPSGRSLATATGERLFPLHAGQRLPGWLDAFGASAMRIAYRGYFERQPLPGGRTLAVLRHEGLVGAYIFQGDRCIGQLLFEPFRLDDPEGFIGRLALGTRARKTHFAPRDARTALDAVVYERRHGALIERRALVTLPLMEDGRRQSVPCLGMEAIYPIDLDGRLAPLVNEGRAGLATFWATHPVATGESIDPLKVAPDGR